MEALKILLIVCGCLIAVPVLINFIDYLKYGRETDEQRRLRKEKEREQGHWL